MNGAKPELLLYVTTDCGLCDKAVGVLAEARAPDFRCVDIGLDAALVARYASQVPVLHEARTGADLYWPFNVDNVRTFLSPGIDGAIA